MKKVNKYLIIATILLLSSCIVLNIISLVFIVKDSSAYNNLIIYLNSIAGIFSFLAVCLTVSIIIKIKKQAK